MNIPLLGKNLAKDFAEKIGSFKSGNALSTEAPIAKIEVSATSFVFEILEQGINANSSDIHLLAEQERVRIRLRIDGMLTDFSEQPKSFHQEIVTRIKVLSGLRTDEHNAAQDGRFHFQTKKGENIDIRVSIIPTYFGENVVLRLLSDHSSNYNLKTLGFSSKDIRKIEAAIKRPYGMILVTGPTGSGKTTTLYTLLKSLNTRDVSVITIEDPIEYAIEGISQIPVNPRTGLSFAHGLRSILRQDPNIIMVGEIRDAETAAISINTALTGHLLLSTLHTNNAAATLPRLLDLKVEQYLIASTVNIVIGQRLVRKICKNCKSFRELELSEENRLKELFPRSEIPKQLPYGKGCLECNNSGFKGRIAIYEILEINSILREAIFLKKSAEELKKIAVTSGMKPIEQGGLEKVSQGITTIEEILRNLYE